MEILNEPVFAPPSKKEGKPYGVTWNGLWSADGLSFGQVGRRMIRAIEQAGMPVAASMDETGVMSTTLCNDYPPTVLAEMGCSLNEEAMERRRVRCEMSGDKDPETPIYHLDGAMNVSLNHILADIHHVLPKHDVLRNILFPQSARFVPRAEMAALHRYKILFTALEADRLAEVDAIEVRKFGQVWVPCGANKQALVKSGVDEGKVHVVPHPMPLARIAELRMAKESVGRRPVTDPNRSYIFYSIGKWEPRKNHPLLIESFLSEFKPAESAVLMLKTSSFGEWDNFPKTPTDAIRDALSKPDVVANGWTGENIRNKVIVNTSLLSEPEMLRLHGTGDCYVTATHGEGWDMPLYDAMVAGSAILTTMHGGAQEYLIHGEVDIDSSIAFLNGTSEVAHRGYGWGHARWGKVDGHDVQEAMRRAFERKCPPVPGRFHAPCYPSAVGKLCRRLILDLCDMTEEKLDGLRLQARQPGGDPQGHGRPVQGRWRRRLRGNAALGRDASPLAPQRAGGAGQGVPPGLLGPHAVADHRPRLRDQEQLREALVPGRAPALRGGGHAGGPERGGDPPPPGPQRGRAAPRVGAQGHVLVPVVASGGVGQGGFPPAHGHQRREHRALVRRGGGAPWRPRRAAAGRVLRAHHPQPRQPPRPDGPQARVRGALLRQRPHLRVRLRGAGPAAGRPGLRQGLRVGRRLRALLGPGERHRRPAPAHHRQRPGGAGVAPVHGAALPRVLVLPGQGVPAEEVMFNKTKEAVEIAKESVYFDLRRLRRRAFDRFLEVSGSLQIEVTPLRRPGPPPPGWEAFDLRGQADDWGPTPTPEPSTGPAFFIGRYLSGAIRSARTAVMDAYFDRYGEQDALDYQHIAMESLAEEMRSHGFPLPTDDICDPEGQGYGNFPVDGVFRQGTD